MDCLLDEGLVSYGRAQQDKASLVQSGDAPVQWAITRTSISIRIGIMIDMKEAGRFFLKKTDKSIYQIWAT